MRPPPAPVRSKAPWRIGLGAKAHKAGHAAEWLAAAWLMAKGYQVLGFRLKSRAGEIDLLARRGGVLAVVEVKRRATLDQALGALSETQKARLMAAGKAVARNRPSLKNLSLRLDMVALAPGRFPRHVRGLSQESLRRL
ncbi:YraN family protein [Brevundimonas sp.]|uniref:YraN family protein n=1 Tax=Brevundimonas sp. TaxID=1871086 RepID=UPI003919F64A